MDFDKYLKDFNPLQNIELSYNIFTQQITSFSCGSYDETLTKIYLLRALAFELGFTVQEDHDRLIMLLKKEKNND